MNAAALFGNLARCGDGMEMKREEEKEQQHSRAYKAPQLVGLPQVKYEHGIESK
jgi:hypothetical protein